MFPQHSSLGNVLGWNEVVRNTCFHIRPTLTTSFEHGIGIGRGNAWALCSQCFQRRQRNGEVVCAENQLDAVLGKSQVTWPARMSRDPLEERPVMEGFLAASSRGIILRRLGGVKGIVTWGVHATKRCSMGE